MSQLIAALKRKYASPRAVMEKLGLDFNLLKNEMMAHDQAPEDLGDPNDGDYQHNCLLRHLAKNMDNVALSEAIEMLETLLRQKATRAEDEEDQPALRKFLRSKGWGKNDIDGACKAASSRSCPRRSAALQRHAEERWRAGPDERENLVPRTGGGGFRARKALSRHRTHHGLNPVQERRRPRAISRSPI